MSRASVLKRRRKAASKLPTALQHVAFTKWSAKKQRSAGRLGTFGPASPVRIIKP